MENNITQLHGVNPEEFKNDILKGVSSLITELLKERISDDRLLTREETATLLSISLPTLRKYVQRGLLKEYRTGARVLYKHSEVINSLTLSK